MNESDKEFWKNMRDPKWLAEQQRRENRKFVALMVVMITMLAGVVVMVGAALDLAPLWAGVVGATVAMGCAGLLDATGNGPV